MGTVQNYKMFKVFTRKFKTSELRPPADVTSLFSRFAQGDSRISAEQLRRFMVVHQRETRVSVAEAEKIIEQVVRDQHHVTKYTRRNLNIDDFFHFLFSADLNGPIKTKVHHDMSSPLSHYFIYTGHNSYLTGNQLSSDCSDVPIIRALEDGVRVIELDVWPNSTKDDVLVLHGRTLTTPVTLIKCLNSIKESGFISSAYPVIITLEDHLTPDLQGKVAQMLIKTFGPLLYCPESEYLDEFPSPGSLRGRIVISTKPPKEYLECNDSGGPSLDHKDSFGSGTSEKEEYDVSEKEASGKDPTEKETSEDVSTAQQQSDDKCDGAHPYGPFVFGYWKDALERPEKILRDPKGEVRRLTSFLGKPEKEDKKPVEKEDKKPVEKEDKKPPLDKEDKKPPLDKDDKKPPLDKDDKKPPLDKEDKKPPLDKEDKKPPLEKEDKKPLEKEEDKKPLEKEEDVDKCGSEPDDEDPCKAIRAGALQYRLLIAIHSGKPKNGIEDALKIVPDKVRRLSLSEVGLEKAVITNACDVVRFTQKNILRVYPKGTRVDSSNYNPYLAWMHGVQMVAFNMQGYGKPLWLMQGMFRANGECGYFKKPDFLIGEPCAEIFDPAIKLDVKTTLQVKIYMGDGWRLDFSPTHFDKYSPPDFYTKLCIVGVPDDVAKRRTKTIEDDWCPIWDEEFKFELTVPELALLGIQVKEYNYSEKNEFGGQTFLPISELRPGIRAVPLFDKKGKRLKSVRLLMRFEFVESI